MLRQHDGQSLLGKVTIISVITRTATMKKEAVKVDSVQNISVRRCDTLDVIMACKNMAHFLRASLDSVLQQTYPANAIIVIDDGSSDSTWEILTSYRKKYKNIKILRNESSRGAGAARNQAISISTSDWIAILDADDIYESYKLEKQMSLIEMGLKKSIVLIGSGCILIDEQGNSFAKYGYPTENTKLKKNLFGMKKFPPHSSLIYRASILKSIGGFREDFPRAQDYELWLRMAKMGEFCCHFLPLVKIRHHETNLSNIGNNDNYTQFEYAFFANLVHFMGYRRLIDESGLDKDMSDIREFLKAVDYSGYRQWLKNLKESLIFNNNKNGQLRIVKIINFNYIHCFLKDRIYRNWLQRKFIRDKQS